eukprot:5748283-Pleurochrysis_carterae.AAC.1
MPHPGAVPAGACRLLRSAAAAARADAAWQGRAPGLNPARLLARLHAFWLCLYCTSTSTYAGPSSG